MTDHDEHHGCDVRFPLHDEHRSIRDVVSEKRDFEELLDSYMKLKASHNHLSAKHKSSLKTISRLRSELNTSKLRLAGKDHQLRSAGGKQCNDVHVLKRLADAERQLRLLSDESKPISNTNNDKENLQRPDPMQDKETIELRRNLQETTNKLDREREKNQANLQTLNELRAINERVLRLFHEYKTKHQSTKDSLASTQRSLDFQLAENEEIRSILTDAMSQNAFLQDQIAKICESCPTPKASNEDSQVLLDTIHQKQEEYDSLMLKYNQLQQTYTKLSSQQVPAHSKDHEMLKQKLAKAEEELDRSKRLLNLQVTISDAMEMEKKELEVLHNDQIIEYQCKIKELTLESSTRLKTMQLLESLVIKCTRNVLEVNVSEASLECDGLSDETRSLILLDYYTFQSVLSPVVKGLKPIYDLQVFYRLNTDQFVLEALAPKSLRVEVYVLNNGKATLFASAAMSQMLLGSHRLSLCRVGDGSSVGTCWIETQLTHS